jgi:hypothetical protein
MSDNRYVVHNVYMNFDEEDDKEAIQVHYSELKSETAVTTSVTHAAFVTCYGRLKLYSE